MITAAELPVYAASLSKILLFIEQLNSAATAGVEPMAHPLATEVQRLRPDAVTEHDEHAKFQTNAPQVLAGLYVVPKVIE